MYRYLAGRLHQLGIRQLDLARVLGMSPASVSHRFCGRVPWSIEEMYQLLDICRAQPEELHIYFPEPVQRPKGRRPA